MSKTALSIVGSSRNNGERQKEDFYPTPSFATKSLLSREQFNGSIWECACGDGAISKVLIECGHSVYSSDIINRGFGISGVDFLNTIYAHDNIITNPPYKYALDFILHAKKCANKKIAMFLKTVFLESESRYDMFQDKDFPLKTVYQFSKRVTLYKDGKKMKNSGMIAYAWFVWDREYKGEPTIKWILNEKHTLLF